MGQSGKDGPPDAVCIRAPNWVGDVVMATPTFRAVRHALPEAQITLLIRRKVGCVLHKSPWFDRMICYDRARGRLRGFASAVWNLRSTHAEMGLVLPNSFSSALMMRLGGVSGLVGYARDGRSFLLKKAVPRLHDEHGEFRPTYMADYYLRLAETAGIPAAARQTELHYDEKDMARTEDILRSRAGVDPAHDLFLLHPGAGYGPAKRWADDRFARLGALLYEEFGAQIALIGGPGEKEHIHAIMQASDAPLVSLCDCGIDLHLLKCVVARSRLMVSTDSGPRHYGVALGIPTVCIMGPNKPAYSTTDRPHDILVRVDQECGPCQRKVCPRDHRCMTDISAEMVLEACRHALSPPVVNTDALRETTA